MESDEDLACLSPMSVMQMSVAAAGGKVHGQLHKAGKVRQQTPKVEKKPKKKRVCKRAYIRKLHAVRQERAKTGRFGGRAWKVRKRAYVRVSVCVQTTLLKK